MNDPRVPAVTQIHQTIKCWVIRAGIILNESGRWTRCPGKDYTFKIGWSREGDALFQYVLEINYGQFNFSDAWDRSWHWHRIFRQSVAKMEIHDEFISFLIKCILVLLSKACLVPASNDTESVMLVAETTENRDANETQGRNENFSHSLESTFFVERKNDTLVSLDLMNSTNYVIVGKKNSSNRKEHELPISLIIASPVAAVTIIVFLCIAYYCHASQLDERAKQLAIQIAVGEYPGENENIRVRVHRPSRCYPSMEADMLHQKRKSLRTPTPPPPGSKRGSMNWSAIADQEILTLAAPRRHSTFILWFSIKPSIT